MNILHLKKWQRKKCLNTKGMMNLNLNPQRDDDYVVHRTIFYRDIKPTKIGILRALNSYGAGLPIEGGK